MIFEIFSKGNKIKICKECFDQTHLTFCHDHRDYGERCKNSLYSDAGKYLGQCECGKAGNVYEKPQELVQRKKKRKKK